MNPWIHAIRNLQTKEKNSRIENEIEHYLTIFKVPHALGRRPQTYIHCHGSCSLQRMECRLQHFVSNGTKYTKHLFNTKIPSRCSMTAMRATEEEVGTEVANRAMRQWLFAMRACAYAHGRKKICKGM